MKAGDNNGDRWCEGRWRCGQELDAPFCDWAWGFERRSLRNAAANAKAGTQVSQHHIHPDARSQTAQERSQEVSVDTTFYLIVDDDVQPIPIEVIGDIDDDDDFMLEVLRLVRVNRASTADN